MTARKRLEQFSGRSAALHVKLASFSPISQFFHRNASFVSHEVSTHCARLNEILVVLV